jgi:hypothetical protein
MLKAVGGVDGVVLSSIFFLQSKNLLIVLGAFFAILHIYGDMSDYRSFHNAFSLTQLLLGAVPKSLSRVSIKILLLFLAR